MKGNKMVLAALVALCLPMSALAITLDEARDIALEHAKLAADQVTFTESRQDEEDGKAVYDIEFYHGLIEYDYEIDRHSGEIIAFDHDAEMFEASGEAVTAERALEIALEHAGLDASEVLVTKTKLDYERGRQVYEVEFSHGRIEYECEIDALTGQITEWDRDED